MVYSNNFVAVAKVNGKILRENQNTVAVPFGSEYSILLKNQNSVRAVANVWIDGVDVTDGNWVIVDAHGSVELERFIRNGNFNKGNKFKFIERTSQIEDHRGIGVDDGLVRVEYRFEVPQTVQLNNYPYYTIWNSNIGSGGIQAGSNVNYTVSTHTTPAGSILRSVESKSSASHATMSASLGDTIHAQAMNCCVTPDVGLAEPTMMFADATPNEAGITVPGGVSHQKFTRGAWFPTEATSSVIVLKLVGKVQGVKVFEPYTVQVKPKCSTCGKLNKATHKHCDRCGTALQLF